MKPNKLLFIVSLVIIVLISLADNRFFAFSKPYNLSQVVRQSAHFILFFITGAIGYLNWKNKERWLQWLWFAAYGFAFIFVIGVTAVTHLLTFTITSQKWITVVSELRSIFIGPIPFMVFWLLSNFTRQLNIGSNTENKS